MFFLNPSKQLKYIKTYFLHLIYICAQMWYYIVEGGDIMFNQQEYINDFIKNTYKTIKLRIRNDDKLLINKINSVDNINKYLIELITKDIYENRKYNFINNDIVIDFDLSNTMSDLVDKAEKADILDDYGLYEFS